MCLLMVQNWPLAILPLLNPIMCPFKNVKFRHRSRCVDASEFTKPNAPTSATPSKNHNTPNSTVPTTKRKCLILLFVFVVAVIF